MLDHFLHWLISPSLILSKKLIGLSNSLNFVSAVGPLYLYTKSSGLTLLSNLVVSSSLLSESLLNIFFCFIFFLLDLHLLLFVFRGFTYRRISKFSLFCYLFLIRRQYFLPERYSYLLILPDDKDNIFAASLLISCCSFSSLIWSSIAMIMLYTYF